MWSELLVQSIVRPRDAARQVLALGVPVPVLIEAALAVTCLGMVLGFLGMSLTSAALDSLTSFILGNPLMGAAIQFAVLFVVVGLVLVIGRAFGGTGDFPGALAIVVWIDAVMLVIQAVQVLALVLLPPVATLLALATIIWVIWALASFVSVLHEFENLAMVLGGLILTMTLIYFGAALVLAGLGNPSQGV